MRMKERLYLTEDRSEVVDENDRRGRHLFCKPGDEIPDEEAKKYGLLKEEIPPEPELEKGPQKKRPKPKPRNKDGLTINKLDRRIMK